MCADGAYRFAVEDVNHLRVSFEFFFNSYKVANGGKAEAGTTHGREVLSIHTLMGEVKAPAPPVGSPDVVDDEGLAIRGRAPRRRQSSSMFSGFDSTPLPTSERLSVKSHWSKVVKHNGWLQKKGGTTKSWMKRYFVLYETSQGHFLSYYAEYWDSPLYNPSRKERNMIDLSKITYLRAKSKYKDVPPFSFDIATIEREWTLSADSNEQLQLWLKMMARAVDLDVAMVPDDTLSFSVKARTDPSRRLELHDYSTSLTISAWGVSVQKLSAGEREEVHFWCYTDFYKWSILRQNGKLALSLQIFTTGDFKTKADFVFRSVDAQAIATAIEYYIEKFMSRMHLRRELDESKAAPEKKAKPAAEVEDLLGAMEGDGMGSGMSSGMGSGLAAGGAEAGSDWASDDEDEPKAKTAAAKTTPKAAPSAAPSLLDLLGDDAPLQPAAAFPPTAPEPFGGNGASELLGLMSISEGVDPEVARQMGGWFHALVGTEAPGLLFRNTKTEVLYKHEFRGSQARISLKQTNHGAVPFSGVRLTVEGAEPHLRTALTPAPGTDPSVLGPGASQTYMLMVECNQPFGAPPVLRVNFTAGGAAASYPLKLPVLMTHFMTPVVFPRADFLARWERLTAEGLEATGTIASSLSAGPMATVKVQQLKLGVAPELGPDGSLLCASTLQIKVEGGSKVVVGCMVRVLIAEGRAAIAVRTASSHVTAALAQALSTALASH